MTSIGICSKDYRKLQFKKQSAISAGYSEKTAYSTGQRMLKNVEVQGC